MKFIPSTINNSLAKGEPGGGVKGRGQREKGVEDSRKKDG